MKTRSGFVSNSSSSSFVIIASKEAYDDVYKSMDEDHRKLLKKALDSAGQFTIGGVKMIDLSYVDHDQEYWIDMVKYVSFERDLEREEIIEMGETIVNTLEKHKDVYVTSSCCG